MTPSRPVPTLRALEASIVRRHFNLFVERAFSHVHGERLGDQPYIDLMCKGIAQLISGKTTRLLINLPPQHLKSFVGTICLASFMLGNTPKLRIILAAYDDTFAEALCGKIRDVMQSAWYRSVFSTRIKDGHSRANDFATTEGGGVFAVSATGAVTGRPADLIIYDDPHQIGDWNKEHKLQAVRENFNIIESRLSNKVNGRMIVIAHRVSDDDLSAELLDDKTWTALRLPLVADRRQTYDLGYGEWVREKGDVLRPHAYPPKTIEKLRRTFAPPFELFYQQGAGGVQSQRITSALFQTFAAGNEPIAPVVLSVDPGHVGGPESSSSAIQVWKSFGGRYFLLDQFLEQCDFDRLKQGLWRFMRKYRPSVVLIEKTANGPALSTTLKGFPGAAILMRNAHQSKAERLQRHLPKIRAKRIMLAATGIWREGFVDEIVNFPNGYDDQVDALTQYLDYMDEKPIIKLREARAIGVSVCASNRYNI